LQKFCVVFLINEKISNPAIPLNFGETSMCWYRDKLFWAGILLAFGSARALYTSIKYAKNPIFSETNLYFVLFIIFFSSLVYFRLKKFKE